MAHEDETFQRPQRASQEQPGGLFDVLSKSAGIGGIALGVFLLLFREFIRKQFFPQLDLLHAYNLLLLFLFLTFATAIAGLAVWVATAKRARWIAILLLLFALAMGVVAAVVVTKEEVDPSSLHRVETKVDDIRTEIASINAYFAALTKQPDSVDAQTLRKRFSARLYAITLTINERAASVLSNLRGMASFMRTVENVPADVPGLKQLGAWASIPPIVNAEKRQWQSVAYIASDKAALELKELLSTLPEADTVEVGYVSENDERRVLPLIAKLGGSPSGALSPAADRFPNGFRPWTEKTPPVDLNEIDDLVKAGASEPSPSTASKRYAELFEQEARIPVPRPHSVTVDELKALLNLRAQLAEQLEASYRAQQISRQEYDYLTGMNRKHSLGMK
jgi:hypothetical protein